MAFINDLAKGFIRSAVNQVGRDGGKVISNKLYGNRHSTPIRDVSQSKEGVYIDNATDEPIDFNALRGKIHEQGFRISYNISDMGILLKIWGYILGVLVSTACYAIYPPLIAIPFLVFIFFIGAKFKLSSVSAYTYSDVASYVQDRRCKGGKRLVGYKRQKVSTIIPANEKEKKVIAMICFVYLLLAISMPLLGYWLYLQF